MIESTFQCRHLLLLLYPMHYCHRECSTTGWCSSTTVQQGQGAKGTALGLSHTEGEFKLTTVMVHSVCYLYCPHTNTHTSDQIRYSIL